jgi:hypothetical protein
MPQYLLSVHACEGEPAEPMTEEGMRRLGALHEEMMSAGAWVFAGHLHELDTATSCVCQTAAAC